MNKIFRVKEYVRLLPPGDYPVVRLFDRNRVIVNAGSGEYRDALVVVAIKKGTLV